ncbi:MAG: MBL fold metallo-hydrolase [Candidatus Pacebacteria bacterium]|nr:MBL fold metallo-hydrolase [Candidatus Paceibacterota bacterium]
MKLTVLVENIASGRLKAEWGLSYLIESDETILFDTGASDLFLKNAELLRVDFELVQKVLLSHGHWDHGTGLQYLENKKIYAHTNIFMERFSGKRSIGLPFSREFLESKNQLILDDQPQKISDNIIFLGEIPRKSKLKNAGGQFTDSEGNFDNVPDDSAIVVIENGAINIITGCAHAGLINTVDYAVKVSGIKKINSVIGGFHLLGNDEITTETIKYLKDKKVKKVYPSHCNQFPALTEFYAAFHSQPLRSGDILTL